MQRKGKRYAPVLPSQNQWIRIWGEVYDVKTVTVAAVATVLAYMDTTLTSNAT
ncbi:unnamed protein product [Penicillium camemberti]|uniref:Str. FM013 n=1 Tax=Penicillium camemberti (strain FM 013) TaxID=1429867 RepID=A0A0G4P3N3_PENC3|nr:unnamed protein product [Penicillium camemberti]